MKEIIKSNLKSIIPLYIHPVFGIISLVICEKINDEKLFIILGNILIIYFLIAFIYTAYKIRDTTSFWLYAGLPWFGIWVFCVVILNAIIRPLLY